MGILIKIIEYATTPLALFLGLIFAVDILRYKIKQIRNSDVGVLTKITDVFVWILLFILIPYFNLYVTFHLTPYHVFTSNWFAPTIHIK